MSEVYPLDSVIKKINSKYKTTDHDEKIVIIDTNTGRSRKKSLFFHKFGGGLLHRGGPFDGQLRYI